MKMKRWFQFSTAFVLIVALLIMSGCTPQTAPAPDMSDDQDIEDMMPPVGDEAVQELDEYEAEDINTDELDDLASDFEDI
jgi:outer membrane biogenesis lipoprotein LolB